MYGMETLYDSQKQSLKIAVAHHDGNNVRNCVCQKKPLSNQLWMEIFPWKSFCQTETWKIFLSNMEQKHEHEKEATVDEIVKTCEWN